MADDEQNHVELRIDLHYDCCCGHRQHVMLYDYAIEYTCDTNDARGPCNGFVDGVGCTLSKHKCEEIMTEAARNDRWVSQELMSWEIFTRLSVQPFFCMINRHNDTRVAISLIQHLVDVTIYEINKEMESKMVNLYLVYFPVNEDDVKQNINNFDKIVTGAKQVDLLHATEPTEKYITIARLPQQNPGKENNDQEK